MREARLSRSQPKVLLSRKKLDVTTGNSLAVDMIDSPDTVTVAVIGDDDPVDSSSPYRIYMQVMEADHDSANGRWDHVCHLPYFTIHDDLKNQFLFTFVFQRKKRYLRFSWVIDNPGTFGCNQTISIFEL